MQILDQLVAEAVDSAGEATPLQLKTTLALIVDSGTDVTLKQYIRNLHTTHQLSTELMVVALRLAWRKGSAAMAFYLLHEVKALGYVTDIDGVNSVLELLRKDNQIKPMMNIAEDVQKGLYGSVSCDSTSLAHLFHAAVRQETPLPLLRCCQFASAQHTLRKLKCDETIFLDALNVCMVKGDVSGAMVVFSLYQKMHKAVRPQAYTLLLSSYVSAAAAKSGSSPNQNDTVSGTNGTYAITPLVEERLRFLVDHIVTTKLDKAQPALADLVLTYLCINTPRGSVESHGTANLNAGGPNSAVVKRWKRGSKQSPLPASTLEDETPAQSTKGSGPVLPSPSAYLRRVLQEYAHLPSVAALQAYAELVQTTADRTEATFLRNLFTEHKMVPLEELSGMSNILPRDT